MALQSLENALFRMTRTLSVKTGGATMHIMSLLLPRGKHNCGQHLHTLSGGVCGSRVFAMIFFCLWKDLLKCVEPCCWNELMKSREAAVKCYIDIASRQSAWLLFTWSNLLGNTFFWLFLICFVMPNAPNLFRSQSKHLHGHQKATRYFWVKKITNGDDLYQVVCRLIS